jgi:hypothetical protein
MVPEAIRPTVTIQIEVRKRIPTLRKKGGGRAFVVTEETHTGEA